MVDAQTPCGVAAFLGLGQEESGLLRAPTEAQMAEGHGSAFEGGHAGGILGQGVGISRERYGGPCQTSRTHVQIILQEGEGRLSRTLTP